MAQRKPLTHHLCDYFFPHSRNNHCPNLFSVTSVVALALAIIVFEAGYLVQTKVVFLKTDFLASVLPGALVALTNQDRVALGLSGVTENPLLDKAAQAAAEDMAANGYFAHNSPDGKTPWYWLDQSGYKYSYAGQNLAVNFTDSENVETAWMNSPTHRANIVKPHYTQVGFGTANGIYEGKETTFVVEFFATPAEIAAVPAEVKPPQEQVSGGQTSAIPAQVIGSQNSTQTPASPNWFARMLASPQRTLANILTILLAVIAISFITVFFVRGRNQHRNVIIGGALLLMCIIGALLISSVVSGAVQLN